MKEPAKHLGASMKYVVTSAMIAAIAASAFSHSGGEPPGVAAINLNTNPEDGIRGKARVLAGGQFDVHNVSLKVRITVAYGVEADRIDGAPTWLDSDHYDTAAFKLGIHREYKMMSVCALIVASGGLKISED